MKRLFILLAVFCCCAVSSAADKKSDLAWRSFDKGLAEAKKADKKVLVDVYTDWCGWCKKMDKVVYSDTQVTNYLLHQFVLVRLNAESQNQVHYKGKTYTEAELAMGFRVTGYPTTLFFKPDGEHITTLPGYLGADDFMNVATFIGDDHYKTMKWEEYLQKQKSKEKKEEN